MRFNKKQAEFLEEVVSQWEANGIISADTANILKNSYAVRPFDWSRLARYSFLIAVACAVIAVGAVIADENLLDVIELVFSAPDAALCLVFAGLAAAVFYVGFRLRRSRPENVFGNEAALCVAVFLLAASMTFLGRILDSGNGHFSPVLLLAAVLYGSLGYGFGSKLVWAFSLLSLGSWFGAETGYVSGWGAYCLGLNYPLRFVLFGATLTGLSFCFAFSARSASFRGVTYAFGLLYMFVALWILSIFGNYGDLHSWERSGTLELLHWSVLFAVAALLAVWYGLRRDDAVARGFGLTFLFINLYTRYFEFFWDAMHKAVFFIILGVSFWLIGRKAEAIRNLEFVKTAGSRAGNADDAA